MAASGAAGEVTVQLPRVLADLTACERSVAVHGSTVGDALADLVRRHPELALHLFDDTGALRRHVLCFRNEVAVHAQATLDEELVAGDRLAVVSSVAGG
jgi:molybdopterin converting factor small subunit